ncbi:MAG: TrbI/VirB10 family protein [Verrucomicrobia bacterium]|nr:TrbI/VirB10 family protein [Verrucomicrobiota bacterium]
MSRRTFIVTAIVIGLSGVVLGIAFLQKGGQQKIAQRQRELEDGVGKVTEPMTTSIRNFNPVPPPAPRRLPGRREAVGVEEKSGHQEARKAAASLTIFVGDPTPAKAPQREPKGDYAPAFRLVKCQLVNTVDSSNVMTPIIGLVTEDLWWNGRIIIRAESEVHGVANIDRVRERIASNGDFTFVLNEPDGSGRELLVHGMVLDMEKDDSLDSYGITDGSAGLRGDVIRTANSDLVKLYAASLISGIAGAFSAGANGVLGNRVYTNNSALGMSALQGAVINPAVGGTQSVLDRYAEQIASSIERDGFFVRVPAGKQFYVYCTEAIDLSKAVVAADDLRVAREDADFAKRQQRSEVRRALPVNASEFINPLLPVLNEIINNRIK